ncbi:rho guanine nucleotide exchange factor 5-like, partial [Mustelus asterias]
FLAHLEDGLEDDIMVFDVCGILLSHIPEFRAVYIPYVTNQSYQEKTFKRLIRNNPHFREAVEELESDPICQRLSLKSFLILPFQRITRLKLLVQNILKRSVPGSDEEQKASKAFEALGELMTDCNENVNRLRSVEALIALNQKIDFESKIFPLVSQSRRLVKDGQLSEMETGNISLSKRKHTSRTIYLHLFNDCILLSRRKENGRFAVFDHTHSRNLVVEDFRVRGLNTARFLFQLTLIQNHQGNFKELLLKANTQTEKLRWISALTPIQQEIDLTQHYDSKQVQCLKSYRAVENDELTLEKADILIVIQGGCDGWEEGYRLSDGDRGWFPTDHVEPILGRNARIRNIEERLRVRWMTDKLQSAASP